MESSDSGLGFRGLRNTPLKGDFSVSGASHLIRSAEKLAATGRFDFAVEQLTVAQKLDPENRYIQAIIDRIRVRQNLAHSGDSNTVQKNGKPSQLSITVGPQFADGIRSSEDDPMITPKDIHTKVRFLTNLANQYLESGSSEKAFDSLMKAYLLDPISPYVIATEKTVLPVWEQTREYGRMNVEQLNLLHELPNNMSNIGTTSMATSNSNNINSPFSPRPSASLSQSVDDPMRMEILKQQKEQERLEKERLVWREASKAPRTFGEDDPATISPSQQQSPEPPKHHSGGLFSRLRLGKFLE